MRNLYEEYKSALKDIPAPALYLDAEAFEKNIQWALTHAGSKKLRVATKSIRSVNLIRQVLESSPIFQGLMTFTLPESLWLRSQGFKDILMGYPTLDKTALKELAIDPSEITLMVDLPEHLHLLNEIAAEAKTVFSVCVDLDLSMDLPFIRFGVYRSALTDLQKVQELMKVLKNSPHVKLVGLMGYEAQIAGVMDKESFLMRFLKKISIKQLRKKRKLIVDFIQSQTPLVFVNGGGTGSLQDTIQEEVVTEVTVGSAFFAPVLFDHYQDFTLTPAMGFSLQIIRHPAPEIYTCLGGGYIASGSLEPIKLPTPYLPAGLKLLKHEGAGEVQTPLRYQGHDLKVGDLVFMRHAKAGEACERFNEIHVIKNANVVGKVPTYRGAGKSFL